MATVKKTTTETAAAKTTKKTAAAKAKKETVITSVPEAAPEEQAAAPTRKRAAKTTKTAKKTTKRKTTKKKTASAAEKKPRKERIFALDIGTRSVIGIVAEQESDGSLTLLDTEREEHKTRAMLDGQIHDVPQVAAVIKDVKKALEKRVGVLHNVAVAAAGRALYTTTAESEMEVSGIITAEQERRLDFAGVQAAQTKLATGGTVDDPTRYYCVGYSTIRYTLDDVQLKTLVGQRGKIAKASVIATFLPRQVIDSMDSALQSVNLGMRAITLEPIAAINVLIPPTMRHLNLVLVDIGAGTSDVAITKNGSVIAYGMVPQAGDEITEAISQRFLLDFNVAEHIKREAADGREVEFDDILGMHYKLKPKDIIEPILSNIEKLAEAIAKQIIDLNGSEPQAVLLVGGGALTPRLSDILTEVLKLPKGRVAVRHPEKIEGVSELPDELKLPDAVTPLGILKIASLNTLHFLTVYVNDIEYRLFNFRDLTVSDALLNAGIQLKKFNGKPGLGIMVTVEGQSKFFPGTMGTLAKLTMNGEEAALDTPISDGSRITIEPGQDGVIPHITLADVLDTPPSFVVYINGEETVLTPQVLLNQTPTPLDHALKDGDVITAKKLRTIGETLAAAGFSPTGRKVPYTLNGSSSQYTAAPEIRVDDEPVTLSTEVHEGDRIDYELPKEPKLGDVLDISELEASLVIDFNGEEKHIPSAVVSLEVNGRPATTNTILTEGSSVRYTKSERRATNVADAMAAVGFVPPSATSRVTVEILVNKKPAQFTDPIKNGDSLDINVKPIGEGKTPLPEPSPEPKLKESLLGDYLSKLKGDKEKAPAQKEEKTDPWKKFHS